MGGYKPLMEVSKSSYKISSMKYKIEKKKNLI